MIASDGLLANGLGHPRAAGTYARVLGHYSRDEKNCSIDGGDPQDDAATREASRSRFPADEAQRRVKVGADADLAIFNPTTVIDRATFDKPNVYSEGIPHVLVNGVFVVRDGKIVEDVKPGRESAADANDPPVFRDRACRPARDCGGDDSIFPECRGRQIRRR